MRIMAAVAGVLIACGTTVLLAETLVLTSGQRVEGTLVGVTAREVVFEIREGFGRRTVRVDRAEIDRIEFDGPGGGGGGLPPTAGRPSGLRERQVQVSARTAWTDTGIDLRPGQTVYFEASGEVRWGPNRRDGAEGEDNSPFNAGRPLPDRPAAALIGRVGESSDPFFVGGERGPIRVRGGGRLFLGVNDDFLNDNTGTLRVRVYY